MKDYVLLIESFLFVCCNFVVELQVCYILNKCLKCYGKFIIVDILFWKNCDSLVYGEVNVGDQLNKKKFICKNKV